MLVLPGKEALIDRTFRLDISECTETWTVVSDILVNRQFVQFGCFLSVISW